MLQAVTITAGMTNEHVLQKTVAYCEGDVTQEILFEIIEHLTGSPSLLGKNRVCALFGFGSRTRQAYFDLRADSTVSVVWSGACLPWPLRPIGFFVAAQSGLVLINDRHGLKRAFENLATLAMVELYSFNTQFLERVVDHVKVRTWRSRIGQVIGYDETYFCFGVDGDSTYTKTGLFGWYSHAARCPTDLIEATRIGVNSK